MNSVSQEIDEMLAKAKERGYSTVLRIGSQGVTYATNVILQTAMKVSPLLRFKIFCRSAA